MDAEWLKTQFDNNPKKTKAELAKSLNLEPPAVSKILSGKRQIKAAEYIAMREFFGLPVDGKAAIQPNISAAILSSLGQESFNIEHSDLEDVAGKTKTEDWIIPAHILGERTNAPSDQIKIFQIKEDRMEPHFRRGEHVVIDLTDQRPSPPGAFIISNGFGFMVRHCEYVPKSNPPRIKISAPDTNFQPQTLDSSDFEIVGRVIGKLQWM